MSHLTLADARTIIAAAEKKADEIGQPVNIAVVDIQTKDLGDNSQPTQQFFGIHTTNGGKVVIFAGGVPLSRDGVIVGGLGVSGGSGEQDQSVALAGQAAL
jgi:uncharacterized protein GlcG (DUF336 family)